MKYSSIISQLPSSVQACLPALPVFDVDQNSQGSSAAFVTREELGEFLTAMEANEAWLIPVRAVDLDDENAALRIMQMIQCVNEADLYLYDQFHVPDIKQDNVMLPCIMVFGPSSRILARLTMMAEIDFIVHVVPITGTGEANTQPLDVMVDLMPISMSMN